MDLDISITRAKTAQIQFAVVEEDGSTPQDLTDAVLYFHAAVYGFTLEKSSPISSGIDISDAAGGIANMTIDPEDTESLGSGGCYAGNCELTMVNDSGTLQVAKGKITISSNVGSP